MADRGGELQFGVSVVPLADPPEFALRVTRAAEEAGLDLVGIQDHPYQRRFLDAWTLIATLVPATERIRFFLTVANLPLRPPAMLAKATASLDLISGGRVEMGLGGGAYWDAIVAIGEPRKSPGEALRAVREAIEVMRLLWSGERSVRYEGEFYSLHGVKPGPRPAHEIGIWLGSVGPRMHRLTGELSDGWAAPIPYYLPYEKWGDSQARIDAGAEESGRDPSEILRIANIPGEITGSGGSRPSGSDPLVGGKDFWAETLAEWAEKFRFDAFVFWPGENPEEQTRRFGEEVVPAVREAVERTRAGGPDRYGGA
jgi:alkanesulfonate monooxygenase SsuD/methylene tetrahydromethanopterin reductase-like flavin-dependent oxidoreductase (luciferase family)